MDARTRTATAIAAACPSFREADGRRRDGMGESVTSDLDEFCSGSKAFGIALIVAALIERRYRTVNTR